LQPARQRVVLLRARRRAALPWGGVARRQPHRERVSGVDFEVLIPAGVTDRVVDEVADGVHRVGLPKDRPLRVPSCCGYVVCGVTSGGILGAAAPAAAQKRSGVGNVVDGELLLPPSERARSAAARASSRGPARSVPAQAPPYALAIRLMPARSSRRTLQSRDRPGADVAFATWCDARCGALDGGQEGALAGVALDWCQRTPYGRADAHLSQPTLPSRG
jgi:hypothetical protein